MQKKKHGEMILAIDTAFFTGDRFSQTQALTAHPFRTLAEDVSPYLTIRERAFLEKNPGYRQIVPYVVVRKLNAGGKEAYFTYLRDGTGSIGFGGHVELRHIATELGSFIDLRSSVFMASHQELYDALKLKNESNEECPSDWRGCSLSLQHMFITDSSDETSQKHFGVVMDFLVPDDFELDCKESKHAALGFKTLEELSELIDSGTDIDNWSRFLIGLGPKTN
jgi:predicted NUDIX family phosphoesterase